MQSAAQLSGLMGVALQCFFFVVFFFVRLTVHILYATTQQGAGKKTLHLVFNLVMMKGNQNKPKLSNGRSLFDN